MKTKYFSLDLRDMRLLQTHTNGHPQLLHQEHLATELGPKAMPYLQELMAVEPAAPVNRGAWRHTSNWSGRSTSLDMRQASQKHKDYKNLNFSSPAISASGEHILLLVFEPEQLTPLAWGDWPHSGLLAAPARASAQVFLPAVS